jgi:hypothetical protein
MCLISISCTWFGTILMYRELCYYSWIIWCFSPTISCWDELSLVLWGFVMLDWVLDLRTLDVCLAMGYLWWQWDVLLIHLMYVLALNSWIPVVTLG